MRVLHITQKLIGVNGGFAKGCSPALIFNLIAVDVLSLESEDETLPVLLNLAAQD